MATPEQVDVWIGLDVGKEEHFADVLERSHFDWYGRQPTAFREGDHLSQFLGRPPAPRAPEQGSDSAFLPPRCRGGSVEDR